MTDVFFDALSLRALRTPTLSVGDLSEYERDSGLHDAQVPVRLSCPLDSPVTAYFATAPGSATEGVDYLAAVGTLELASGEAVGYVPVPIVGDTVDEPAETLFLDAGPIDPDDVVGLDPRGTLTLLDDDFCRRSPGYWKTHREQWPVDWLLLGAVEYDDTALMDFLRYGGSDGSTRLARHLTATKLNLARGSDPWILPTVEAADAFLALLPPGSRPGGDDLSRANALKDELDAYNNSGCDEP